MFAWINAILIIIIIIILNCKVFVVWEFPLMQIVKQTWNSSSSVTPKLQFWNLQDCLEDQRNKL